MQQFLASELFEDENLPSAKFQVIPVPLERTVSYGAGTERGPLAILAASAELERMMIGQEPIREGIWTQDPVDCHAMLPDVMELIAQRTEDALALGQVPVVLGGEHSLTYGAVMGVKRALPEPIGVIQIDAHADLRDAYQGERHSHASVMHLLAQEGVSIAQFGVRALSNEEQESRTENEIYHVDAEELVTQNIHHVALPADFPEHVYISFDVDGLDPAIMSATGTPVPGGLSYYQAMHICQSALSGRKLVGFDVVELAPNGCPACDFTAAMIAYRLMALCEMHGL